ncbi:MAG: hypothetical protein QG670_1931 [Thermoproteota archaeon]|nr:hypothetical protein [Thermoproteota archaeon]
MIPRDEAMLDGKPKLIHVKYMDHVEFRNLDSKQLKECVREVVGWLVRETNEALCICCDRAVDPLPFGKSSESGFIILKSDVLETRRIKPEEKPNHKKG